MNPNGLGAIFMVFGYSPINLNQKIAPRPGIFVVFTQQYQTFLLKNA